MSKNLVYVKSTMTSGEELIHVGHFHWFYIVKAFFSLIFSITVALGINFAAVPFTLELDFPMTDIFQVYQALSLSDYLRAFWYTDFFIRIAAFAVFFLGLYTFISMMIIMATTEIAVTNKRFIYKKGLIARKVKSMNVDRIESADTDQTALGRILNYGDIITYGMGVGKIDIPPFVADPLTFCKALEWARDH